MFLVAFIALFVCLFVIKFTQKVGIVIKFFEGVQGGKTNK